MKAILCFFSVVLFGFLILTGCKRDNSLKQEDIKVEFSGILDSVSPCKNKMHDLSIGDSTDSLCCIFYVFHSESNNLRIKHENVYFNCCPDSMYVKISKSNDTIFIYESDNDGNCGCICKYDLEMEINGIEAKKYKFIIKVIPHPMGQNTEFEVDFSKVSSGVYCYKRNNKK